MPVIVTERTNLRAGEGEMRRMGRNVKWLSKTKQSALHVSPTEREKRDRLRAELAAEASTPLAQGGQRLSPRERASIALEISGLKLSKSWW